MAVAKCTAVSGRSRGQLSTYFQRREAVWPSFCAHAELERWTAAGPLARKPRRALVERFLTTAKRPHEATSKHALHRGGTRTGSLAGGAAPAASMVAALPQPPRVSARTAPCRTGTSAKGTHRLNESNTHTAT